MQSKKNRLLAELADCGNAIKGSLTRNRRRCGKPQCRCTQGKLHESLAITYKQERKSCLVHVPEHLQKQAKDAVKDYHKIKEIIEQISKINVDAFRRKAQKKQKVKKKTTGSTDRSPQSGGVR